MSEWLFLGKLNNIIDSARRLFGLCAGLVISTPALAGEPLREAGEHYLFAYAEGRLYGAGLSHDACSVKDSSGYSGAAVVFVDPGWIWRDGAVLEGCWSESETMPGAIEVCVVRAGHFIGECSWYGKQSFVDPNTLPRPAF